MSWSWGSLLTPITGTIGKISDNRMIIKKREIDRIINAEDKIAEWESIQAEKRSWLTSWFSIILSIPLVGAFFPPLVPHILAGFEVLNQMPEYYQYWVAAAILSSLGIRALRK